jgi:RNA recognition motif-containing protein
MNIFVAKMSYDTTAEQLRELFEQFGEVSSAKIIFDKIENRSKGFGFVEMDNDAEALAAINELNGADLDGRSIVVKKSEPRSQDSRGGGGGGNRFGGGGGRGGNSDRRPSYGDDRRPRKFDRDNRY